MEAGHTPIDHPPIRGPNGEVQMVVLVSRTQLPIAKRALMTGVNMFVARALLRERLWSEMPIDRWLWAGCFAFAFAPHPHAILGDTYPFLPTSQYAGLFLLQMARALCFEVWGIL